MVILILIKLPIIEPAIKLDPITKLIGKLIDSLINKLTLLFFELFWIPIINKNNKEEFNNIEKNIFFKVIDIERDLFINFSANYKFRFLLTSSFLLNI